MKDNSRLPGFYDLPIEQRWATLLERKALDEDDLAQMAYGGLTAHSADGLVENAVGLHALPLGIGLNFTINGRDHLVAMAVEEPSVIAAASNAARIIRGGGGFLADADPPIMAAQIEIRDVADTDGAALAILAEEPRLLEQARDVVPRLVARGGGPRSIEVRTVDRAIIVVHLYIDCRDAMGANLVNTLAEAMSAPLCALANGRPGLRILTNLSDRRCVRVRARVPLGALETDLLTGAEVGAAIAAASHFAEVDPYRATTHNKGIMNGVDAVVIASGNDWRATEAGAHAFAARNGAYRPLAVWRVVDDSLRGTLEMPLALGTVGGTSTCHAGARAALRLMNVQSSGELACIAGAAGLASNFAALRALATDGIQRGHMRMHHRAVGSTPSLVARAATISATTGASVVGYSVG